MNLFLTRIRLSLMFPENFYIIKIFPLIIEWVNGVTEKLVSGVTEKLVNGVTEEAVNGH